MELIPILQLFPQINSYEIYNNKFIPAIVLKRMCLQPEALQSRVKENESYLHKITKVIYNIYKSTSTFFIPFSFLKDFNICFIILVPAEPVSTLAVKIGSS